jgi:hypothetical protein
MKMPSRNRARSIEELREFGFEAPAQAPGLAARTGPRARGERACACGHAGSVARLGGQGTRVSVAVILRALACGMDMRGLPGSSGAGGRDSGGRLRGRGRCRIEHISLGDTLKWPKDIAFRMYQR